MTAESKHSEKHSTILRSPVPFVIGLGMIMVVAMGYSLIIGSQATTRYAPLMDAAMEIKLEITMGHLWFEEVISGDRNENIANALAHLDQSAWYARAMLEGGKNSEGHFEPLHDPALRSEIEEVLEKILEFRAIAEARWQAIEESGIGSKIDQDFDALFNELLLQADNVETALQEVMARELKRFRAVQILLILFCLGVAVLIGIVFRRYQKSLLQGMSSLQKNEEKLAITLNSIGDAVIATNTAGEVTRMNPVAEKLTGWKNSEALGRPLAEVFQIINSKTRMGVENPVAKVLDKGMIVGMANHTVLISRNGTECQIADSGAPIKDTQGNIIGVVLVFRDVSESYAKDHLLRQSEEKFRTLYDNAPLSYQSLDEEGCFLDINPTWLKTLGYEKEEVIGLPFADFLHPDWKPHFKKNFPEFKRRGQVHDVQFKIRHKNGTYRDISFEGSIGYHPDGTFHQTYCVFQDITEKNLAQEKASRFSHILESTLNEIYIFDSETYLLIEVNRGARENLGFSMEELSTMNALDLKPEITADHFTILVAPLRSGAKEIVLFNTVHRRKDGSLYPVEVHLQMMTHFGTSLFVAITLDISERKQKEEEREQLIKAIEQTTESIVITDAGGTILYTNPIFEQITGYSNAEAIGLNPRILKSEQHDDDFYREMWKTISGGETWRGQIINQKKDGSLFTEDASISPVFDEAGVIVNYVSVKRDITDRIHLEEQYHQAQKVESIGRLAGGVAHDLNNLLTPILGYGEMMLADFSPDDARREGMDIILRSGIRARDLVRQLLAFSRKQTLEYKPEDLNQIITNFESLLRRTTREDIQIAIVTSPKMSTIMADVGQIEQVIMNLTVNAADAMPDGGQLTIETMPVELDEEYTVNHHGVKPGPYCMLAMSDTGCGIADETMEKIFEPFFSTKGEQGTGLGLATVYGIVKQHGGNIWVYSEPGKGTTFKVYLPASDESLITTSATEATTTPRQCFESILLAEDNKDVRDLASTILTREGYTVLVAENGPSALELMDAHEGPLDLLLTDVVMPEMNGKKLFSLAAENHPQLKVLYMSGYTDNVIVHRGVLDENTSFIQKPFAIKALVAKVREVLNQE